MTSKKRIEDIFAYSMGIMEGENGRLLIEKYKESLETLTPHDMLAMENKQLERGVPPDLIKKSIGKVINSFYKALSSYKWEKPGEGEFLFFMMAENSELEKRLGTLKTILRQFKREEEKALEHLKTKLLPRFTELKAFDAHYIKKENILFPYLEKGLNRPLFLQVMWSLHDDIRKSLKKILDLLQNRKSPWEELNREIGNYFFLVYGMIFKENLIVYPAAYETIPAEYWMEMQEKSFEFPFAFITPPHRPEENKRAQGKSIPQIYQTKTGSLSFEQLDMIFRNLPLDITYVDENDQVIYFSPSKERIFPRSTAIIGRKVQNCHPPESVHLVEKIISSFKDGTKDSAWFWINAKNKRLLIQYFAVRDEKSNYRGVLETTQDITEIQTLEGEKKLLDWD